MKACFSCKNPCCKIEGSIDHEMVLHPHEFMDLDKIFFNRTHRHIKGYFAEKNALFYLDYDLNGGSCPFYDKTNRKCTIYESRPIICRRYPLRIISNNNNFDSVLTFHSFCPASEKILNDLTKHISDVPQPNIFPKHIHKLGGVPMLYDKERIRTIEKLTGAFTMNEYLEMRNALIDFMAIGLLVIRVILSEEENTTIQNVDMFRVFEFAKYLESHQPPLSEKMRSVINEKVFHPVIEKISDSMFSKYLNLRDQHFSKDIKLIRKIKKALKYISSLKEEGIY